MKKNSEVLSAARELIDTPDKWCKNGYCNAFHTKFCVEGAIAIALTGNIDWLTDGFPQAVHIRGTYDDLLEEVGSMGAEMMVCSSKRGGYYPRYLNDNPETEHSDVMALLDKAIAFYQERGE